jgi:nucleotide-binding universal stress UspA family protein
MRKHLHNSTADVLGTFLAHWLLMLKVDTVSIGAAMPHVKNILVPIDTHENAGPVVQWASLLAHATQSRLNFAHVNESLELLKTRPGLHGGGFPGLDVTLEKWRKQYQQETHAAMKQLAQQYCSEVSVIFLPLEGRAAPTILEAIKTTSSDVVVMGTHGRPWYQRAFLGSTAEAVLRSSEVPVLIVHNSLPSPQPPRLERLLFSTDFSPASAAGEEWVHYLTRHGAKEAVLVHAIENPLLDAYAPDDAPLDLKHISEDSRQHAPRSAQPYWEHAHQQAKAKLSVIREQLLTDPPPGFRADILPVEGSPALAILNAATQHNADFIVMATHGRTGVRRFVLGSVTEKVIRTATCPVLAVPSKAAGGQ